MGSLSRFNISNAIEKQLKCKELTYDILEWIFYFMDFAIHTNDLKFIESIFNEIILLYLDFFRNK